MFYFNEIYDADEALVSEVPAPSAGASVHFSGSSYNAVICMCRFFVLLFSIIYNI